MVVGTLSFNCRCGFFAQCWLIIRVRPIIAAFHDKMPEDMQPVLDSVAQQLALSDGEVRRLFHGRGHCYPGLEDLVIDWFPPVAVIRLYRAVDQQWLDRLTGSLKQFSMIEGLVVQLRGRGQDAVNQVAWGEVPEEMEATELGLRYWVKPQRNQNSGLFLDMRKGRQWVKANAQGLRVLNLFAYTCAFSAAALAGGASHVVNVDMSGGAIATGRRNSQLNGFDRSAATFLSHDLFKSWKKVRQAGPYELVVIDPPSFQPGSFVAEKDYRRVIRRLNELTEPGAQVLACHNDPKVGTEFLCQIMKEECPGFNLIQRLDNPDDFPEAELEKGLKVLLYKREEL